MFHRVKMKETIDACIALSYSYIFAFAKKKMFKFQKPTVRYINHSMFHRSDTLLEQARFGENNSRSILIPGKWPGCWPNESVTCLRLGFHLDSQLARATGELPHPWPSLHYYLKVKTNTYIEIPEIFIIILQKRHKTHKFILGKVYRILM